MPGLVIGGKEYPVPGVNVLNWHDDPKLRVKMPEDGRRRRDGARVTLGVVHTTKGIPGGSDVRPQLILAGKGPDVRAEERALDWWSSSSAQSGAHGVTDADGSAACIADLLLETTFHAKSINEISFGWEIYQGHRAEIYQAAIEATVAIFDVATRVMGIQRQTHWPWVGPIARLAMYAGRDCTGIIGHRDQTRERGQGDPGDAAMKAFHAAGYEVQNWGLKEDLTAWRERQALVCGFPPEACDGIPGPRTLAALKTKGYHHGLWVRRPGD